MMGLIDQETQTMQDLRLLGPTWACACLGGIQMHVSLTRQSVMTISVPSLPPLPSPFPPPLPRGLLLTDSRCCCCLVVVVVGGDGDLCASYVLLQHPEVPQTALLAFLLRQEGPGCGHVAVGRFLVGGSGGPASASAAAVDDLVQRLLLRLRAGDGLLTAPVAKYPAHGQPKRQRQCRPEDGVEDVPAGDGGFEDRPCPDVERVEVTRHNLSSNAVLLTEVLDCFTIIFLGTDASAKRTLRRHKDNEYE